MKHTMHLIAVALILSLASACTKNEPPVKSASTGKTVVPVTK